MWYGMARGQTGSECRIIRNDFRQAAAYGVAGRVSRPVSLGIETDKVLESQRRRIVAIGAGNILTGIRQSEQGVCQTGQMRLVKPGEGTVELRRPQGRA